MFCPNCGKELNDVSGEFCPQCGHNLQKARESYSFGDSPVDSPSSHTEQMPATRNTSSSGISLRPAMFTIAIVLGAIATYLTVASQDHGAMGYPNDMWEWYNYDGGSNVCLLLFVVAFIAAVIGVCAKSNKK